MTLSLLWLILPLASVTLSRLFVTCSNWVWGGWPACAVLLPASGNPIGLNITKGRTPTKMF